MSLRAEFQRYEVKSSRRVRAVVRLKLRPATSNTYDKQPSQDRITAAPREPGFRTCVVARDSQSPLRGVAATLASRSGGFLALAASGRKSHRRCGTRACASAAPAQLDRRGVARIVAIAVRSLSANGDDFLWTNTTPIGRPGNRIEGVMPKSRIELDGREVLQSGCPDGGPLRETNSDA